MVLPRTLKALAVMEASTVLTMDTFWLLPTARNSKRWPPKGKGDVRLRSSAGTCGARSDGGGRGREDEGRRINQRGNDTAQGAREGERVEGERGGVPRRGRGRRRPW